LFSAEKQGFWTRGERIRTFDLLLPTVNVCSIRYPENVTQATTKDCDNSKSALTRKLTPAFKKQPKIDTSELSPDLVEIITLWPELPEHIKAAIKALSKHIKRRNSVPPENYIRHKRL
jgi:hypothetical protein